jgi:hypothetical protein
MKRPWAAILPPALLGTAIVLLACGGNGRSLQSVSVSPATATSQAQFTALGVYNLMPTSVNITGSTTWCIGSPGGMCAADIAIEASVTAGLAQCASGFTGTLTVLAGQAASMPGINQGFQLKPFGAAQLMCP